MGEILRDYTHASDIFVDGGSYLGAPTDKRLFHVMFDSDAGGNVGLAVKTAKLPGFTVMTEVANQYNRSRIIQKKIKYNPVDFTFHDDHAGVSRALWSKYYQFYFSDSVMSKSDPNTRDIYGDGLLGWGRILQETPFINSITIYSLFGSSEWHSYQLIKPIISKWEHDTHAYAEPSGIMENKMTVEYESVVYDSGGGAPPGYGG